MKIDAIGNMKISSRMLAGFSLLLVLMLALVATGLACLQGMKQRLDAIVNDNNVKIELTQDVRFFARHEAVVIRNILLLRDPAQREKEVGRRAEAQAKYRAAEEKLMAMKHDEKSKEIIGKLQAGRKATLPLWDKVVQLGLQSKPDEGITVLITEVRKVQWQWLDGLDELAKHQNALAKASSEDAARAYKRSLVLSWAAGGGALLFGILIALALSRSVTRPLAEFQSNMARIAGGDLTTVLTADRKDEFGDLARTMNTMTGSYDKIMSNLMTSSNELVNTVSVVKSRTVATTRGAQNQSTQASHIATSAEEMSQTITDISKNAASVAEAATSAKNTAADGRKVTEDAVIKVNSVYTSTVELAGRVEQLNKSIGEISDIVSFITGIADQTNLLALNAAIEAARAGEQGRGFAVVADEVRKLAERTIKATTEISEKIGAVQKESAQTAEVMGATSVEVTSAKEFITKVGDALEAASNSVQAVSDQITRIAAAVEEQSAASEDVARNIEQTSHIASEMETSSKEVMHEVNSLTHVAEQLRSGTSGITTSISRDMIFDLARTDHRIFVDKIGACLNNDLNLDPAELPTHQTCRLGKWCAGEGKERCGGSPAFIALDEPHTRIHAMAKEAVAAHNSGDEAKAGRIYGELEGVSGKIADLLERMKREAGGRSSAPAAPVHTAGGEPRERAAPAKPQPAPGAALAWTDDYSVNVAEMDAQHKRLFDLINELRDAMREGAGKAAAGEVLNRLVEYATTHLSDEEKLMQKYGYPGFTGQKIAHDNLKKKVADYVDKYASGKITTVEIMNFLKDWLTRHILGSDKKYGPFLNGKGVH